jgi:hypothetical protein
VAAQAEFAPVAKDKDNPFFKSRYADLASVMATVQPVLARHKLAVTQLIGFTVDESGAARDTLTTILAHESGEALESVMLLHMPKKEPQAQGSATTYARRYALMSLLNIVADDDDDGNRGTPQLAPAKRMARKQHGAPPAGPSAAQTKALFALQGELGITTREERLASVSRVVGREVVSSGDLSAAEVSMVIDHYKANGTGEAK